MHILSSAVSMHSSHAKLSSKTVAETSRFWIDSPQGEKHDQNNIRPNLPEIDNEISSYDIQEDSGLSVLSPELEVMRFIFEKIFGKEFSFFFRNFEKYLKQAEGNPQKMRIQKDGTGGWGYEYERKVTVFESENTKFSANGIVRTADGRELAFDLGLEMDRSFLERHSTSLRMGEPKRKDPLVINFGGNAAMLSDTRFEFDIDLDGEPDSISRLKQGSGFLAFDRNGDGKINNGGELFGTRSGNGFAELAAFDSDGNGWIDEADPVYDQLQILARDGAGRDSLYSLKDKDVGAIYLNSIATPFEHRTGVKAAKGEALTTGVYLKESGGSGSVQQLNLYV